MGKLSEALNQRNMQAKASATADDNEINVNIKLQTQEDEDIERIRYDEKWLNSVMVHMRYAATEDQLKVRKILAALDRRNGQCPCGGNGPQFKCPCHIMRGSGICKCGLFQNVSDRKVHGATTSARIG